MTRDPSAFVHIDASQFLMGSVDYYPEEAPIVLRAVEQFALCAWPVTNSEFEEFVRETGYTTTAERDLDPADFPDAQELDTAPGSLVFTESTGPVDLRNWRLWWRWLSGASWRTPYGPGSSIEGLGQHPVVHVSFLDAIEYCEWAGARLPSEAEWELAARGGLKGATYAWGEEFRPDGALMANTWQGSFPYDNHGAHGWTRTSPVRTFMANGFGLFDMIGNVWEWTSDSWTSTHNDVSPCGCSPVLESAGEDRVLKGGSHLCAPEYCQRYRPAARSRQSVDSSTSHLGFRVARDLK